MARVAWDAVADRRFDQGAAQGVIEAVGLLAAAVVFYFTVHRRTAQRADTRTVSLSQRAVAVISLLLWLGVGVAGRAIGLL